MPLVFDYSKLKGRIKEKGFTQKTIAEAIEMSASTFSLKLNNLSYFIQDEISKLIKILEIPWNEIRDYFFTLKV